MYNFTCEIADNSGELFQDSLVKWHIKFEMSLISPVVYDFTCEITFNSDDHLHDWLVNENLVGEGPLNW